MSLKFPSSYRYQVTHHVYLKIVQQGNLRLDIIRKRLQLVGCHVLLFAISFRFCDIVQAYSLTFGVQVTYLARFGAQSLMATPASFGAGDELL